MTSLDSPSDYVRAGRTIFEHLQYSVGEAGVSCTDTGWTAGNPASQLQYIGRPARISTYFCSISNNNFSSCKDSSHEKGI